jgi:hypothetical protein
MLDDEDYMGTEGRSQVRKDPLNAGVHNLQIIPTRTSNIITYFTDQQGVHVFHDLHCQRLCSLQVSA